MKKYNHTLIQAHKLEARMLFKMGGKMQKITTVVQGWKDEEQTYIRFTSLDFYTRESALITDPNTVFKIYEPASDNTLN